MKKNWNYKTYIRFALLVVSLVWAGCHSHDQANNQDTYLCPMHPTVVSDRPGVCPVCNMDLVRKARPGEELVISREINTRLSSPSSTILSNTKTTRGTFDAVSEHHAMTARAVYDPDATTSIAARVTGRLERITLHSYYQYIKKGQILAHIYSPELIRLQQELLYMLHQSELDTLLIEAAQQNLLRLGLSRKQLDDIVKNKKIIDHIAVISPATGYVISPRPTDSPGATQPIAPPSAMNNMLGTGSSTPTSSSQLPREGDYVAVGDLLYSIADPGAIRIDVTIPSNLRIARGDSLTLHLDVPVKTLITHVKPFFNEGEPFATARIRVDNGSAIPVNTVFRASLQRKTSEALWLPREAVYDMGLQKIVFVKREDVFLPRKVITGIIAHEWIEIIQGITSADEIASRAGLLVDSESLIKITN